MANLPKRPLDFERFVKSEEARTLLAKETLRHWANIFGWKDKRQFAGWRLKRPARQSK